MGSRLSVEPLLYNFIHSKKMSTIINLTPHAITVVDSDNAVIATFPSAGVARAATARQTVDSINGIPVNRSAFGAVSGLPDPQPDTFFIVSALAAQACPGRSDLLIVDDTVRNDAGQIIGCRAFARV